MQQIADIVGVSRGTVDRALHNRGRVNPEIARKIAQTAQELGYQPNMIGQALAHSKRDFKLGAILQSTETPTMQDIAQSMKQAADDLRGTGIELLLREVQGLNADKVLEHIDMLQEQGIPVVTLNSDVPDSRRMCFVGMDNYRAGQTAAWLTCQMLPVQSCFDRDDYTHDVTQRVLREHPDLAAVYVTSHGQEGVCQAIEEEGGKAKVIAYVYRHQQRNSYIVDICPCGAGDNQAVDGLEGVVCVVVLENNINILFDKSGRTKTCKLISD